MSKILTFCKILEYVYRSKYRNEINRFCYIIVYSVLKTLEVIKLVKIPSQVKIHSC